jgi:hypothetical protein
MDVDKVDNVDNMFLVDSLQVVGAGPMPLVVDNVDN